MLDPWQRRDVEDGPAQLVAELWSITAELDSISILVDKPVVI